MSNKYVKYKSTSWKVTCMKEDIQSDNILAHFDPKLPLILATDSSPFAVGAVLSHVFPDNIERPLQFASKKLSQTQQKYLQKVLA